MNNHFRRISGILATTSFVLLLTACGGNDDEESRLGQVGSSSSLPPITGPSSSSSSSLSSSSVSTPAGSSSSATVGGGAASSVTNQSSSISSRNSSTSSSSSSSPISVVDSLAPSSPVLSKKSLLTTSVSLSWTAASDNTGVAGYRVFRDGRQIAKVNSNTLNYTDKNLLAGTSYRYTVRAADASGNLSDLSNTLDLKTLLATKDVVIEWFIPDERENGEYLELDEIGGYEIRYKLTSETEYRSVVVEDGTIDHFALGALLGDYEFQIATFDVNGLYSEFVPIDPL